MSIILDLRQPMNDIELIWNQILSQYQRVSQGPEFIVQVIYLNYTANFIVTRKDLYVVGYMDNTNTRYMFRTTGYGKAHGFKLSQYAFINAFKFVKQLKTTAIGKDGKINIDGKFLYCFTTMISEAARFEYVRAVVGAIIDQRINRVPMFNGAYDNETYNVWDDLLVLVDDYSACVNSVGNYASLNDCYEHYRRIKPSQQNNYEGINEYNALIRIGLLNAADPIYIIQGTIMEKEQLEEQDKIDTTDNMGVEE